jgi:hypothetical protein
VGFILVFVVTALPLLRWVYLAHANLRAFGVEDPPVPYPALAVGWFFVPIANLWMPYSAMAGLWRASEDVDGWRTRRGTLLLPAWWASWLLSGGLAQAAGRLHVNAGEKVEDLRESTLVDAASSLAFLAASLLVLWIVVRIDRRQRDQAERRQVA